MNIESLDATVSSEELVNLPTEFAPDAPTQNHVRQFSQGDNKWDDDNENVDGDAEDGGLRACSVIWKSAPYFEY